MSGTSINEIVLVIILTEYTYMLCCVCGLDIEDDIFRGCYFGINEEDIMI